MHVNSPYTWVSTDIGGNEEEALTPAGAEASLSQRAMGAGQEGVGLSLRSYVSEDWK